MRHWQRVPSSPFPIARRGSAPHASSSVEHAFATHLMHRRATRSRSARAATSTRRRAARREKPRHQLAVVLYAEKNRDINSPPCCTPKKTATSTRRRAVRREKRRHAPATLLHAGKPEAHAGARAARTRVLSLVPPGALDAPACCRLYRRARRTNPPNSDTGAGAGTGECRRVITSRTNHRPATPSAAAAAPPGPPRTSGSCSAAAPRAPALDWPAPARPMRRRASSVPPPHRAAATAERS